MAQEDRDHWDERYRHDDQSVEEGTPRHLVGLEHLLPASGRALDVACGQGRGSRWLARRGLEVWGVDVSLVAIEAARRSAVDQGLECCFDVFDLDDGLPPGPLVDVMLCHLFRSRALDGSMMQRLASGGVLVVVSLSEVGSRPGPFRAAPGELAEAFDRLELLHHSEDSGVARFIGRAAGP